MRAVRKLSGAFVMAGLVAAALVVSVAPAAAEPQGLHEGSWKGCSHILAAMLNQAEGSMSRAVLEGIYNTFCSGV